MPVGGAQPPQTQEQTKHNYICYKKRKETLRKKKKKTYNNNQFQKSFKQNLKRNQGKKKKQFIFFKLFLRLNLFPPVCHQVSKIVTKHFINYQKKKQEKKKKYIFPSEKRKRKI